MITPFLIGAILAFLGAIPVAGPVSALVLKFGLKKQMRRGWMLSAGAAVAESVYVLCAFLGFSVFLKSIPYLEVVSKVVASLIFIGLGFYFVFSKTASQLEQETVSHQPRNRGAFWMGFMISIVNPTLMATWTAIITTLYGYHLFQFSTINAVTFSVGVLAGIVGWFTTLLWMIHRHHHRFKPEWVRKLLLVMGIVLLVSGFYTVIYLAV